MRAIQCISLSVFFAVFGFVLTPTATADATPATIVMSREAISSVTVDTAPLLHFVANAWGDKFLWRATNVGFLPKESTPASSVYTWNIPAGKITGTATLTSPSPHALQWDWALAAAQGAQRLPTGGDNFSTHSGLTFTLDLDSPVRRGCKAVPELNADKTGFTWEMLPGKTVAVTFAHPLPSITFERGQKNEIMAMLYQAPYDAGDLKQTMTITMPDEGKVVESEGSRYDNADTTGWFTNALDDTKSFIDLSDLNDKPAGKHGFLEVHDGHFAFSDGTPVRFWGGSVAAYTLYAYKNGKTDYAGIDAQAKRLASLGFNMVRLTHIDSSWVGHTFLQRHAETSNVIDEQGLDCIFYWVKALKENGIYVVVDMITYRPFFKTDDIPGWDEIYAHYKTAKDQAMGQGYVYLSDRIQELWESTTQQLVTRVNPYTHLALKDDPAIASMVIWNENDLTQHFGLLFLADKNNPFHRKLFLDKLNAFAQQWSLNAPALGQTWLPGPNKLLTNDMEYSVNRKFYDFMHAQGVKVPIIAGHVWAGMSAYSLPALTAGDVIDSHGYNGPEFIRLNPHYLANDFMSFAQGALAGYPKFVSEYNIGGGPLDRDRYTVPLYMATLGAFQNYDGLTIYAYGQSGVASVRAGMWDTNNDPQVMGMAPVAALMYRLGYVSPAKETLYISLTEQTGLFKTVSDDTSATLRTGFETHGIRLGFDAIKELPWFKPTVAPAGATTTTDLQQDFIPPGDSVTSDTGQFTRNWVKGQMTVNTPCAQLVMGAIGGDPVKTADATFTMQSPQGAVALCSIDRQPLRQSHRILLSTAGRVMPGKNGTPVTYLSEPVAGTIQFRSSVAGLQLIPLKGDGTKLAPIALQANAGVYTIDLPTNLDTHWFELDAPQ